MFGLEDDELIANLERMRQARCGYGAGPDGRCDCKYGASGKGEETGCPELRQVVKLLSGQREEVIVLRQRFEQSAANTLRQIRHLLAPDERTKDGEQ